MLHIQGKHQSASQRFQLHWFKAGVDIYYSAWRNDTSQRDTLLRPDALLMNYRYSTCSLACQLNCWLWHIDHKYNSKLLLACARCCFVICRVLPGAKFPTMLFNVTQCQESYWSKPDHSGNEQGYRGSVCVRVCAVQVVGLKDLLVLLNL